MFKNYLLAFTGTILLSTSVQAQQADSTAVSEEEKPKITLSAFADVYYNYDFNEPESKRTPGFLYSHMSHNQFALNNAILSAKYSDDKLRGAFSLQAGTYVQQNYAAEPQIFQNVYEAYAGYQLAKGLWLDAGIFASHMGAESAISIDNLTYTRSMMAENTPYFETGAKLTYEIGKFTLSGLVLNGWQNIVDNNDNIAIGTQIQFKPTDKILLNSSSFIGKEKPGYFSPLNPNDPILYTQRFFHNFYSQFILGEKVTLLAAFDIGWQEKTDGDGFDTWYNPNLIIRFMPGDKFAIAGRIEYYNDEKGVIIATGTENGFKTLSPSLTLDYRPVKKVAFRVEGKLVNSEDKIFTKDNKETSNESFLISSVAFKF